MSTSNWPMERMCGVCGRADFIHPNASCGVGYDGLSDFTGNKFRPFSICPYTINMEAKLAKDLLLFPKYNKIVPLWNHYAQLPANTNATNTPDPAPYGDIMLQWGEPKVEKQCKCDIKTLLSTGHESNCEY